VLGEQRTVIATSAALVRFTAMAAMAVAVAAAADEPLPTSPLDPTYEQCGVLMSAYGHRVSELAQADLRCMSQHQPVLGHCGGCAQGLTAFTPCCGYQEELCQVQAQEHDEVALCQGRAAQRVARERAEDQARKREEDEARRLADGMRHGNDLYDRFTTTMSALKDPESFVRDALGINSPLYGSLFGRGGKPEPGSTSTLDELYRYLWNQHAAGVEAQRAAGMSPIIGAIQDASRDRLKAHFDELKSQLDVVSGQIRDFNADGKSPRPPPPAPLARRPSAGSEIDCSALRDPAASQALMDRDQDAWLRLVSQCK